MDHENRVLIGIFCPIFFDKFSSYFSCFCSFFDTSPTLFFISSTRAIEFLYLISIPDIIRPLPPSY